MGLKRFVPKRLKTPGGEILLREVQRKDLRALNGIINEPEVNRFVLVPAPVSMKSTLAHYLEKKKVGSSWIACEFEGKTVGSIELRKKVGRESHVGEFGIAFTRKVHGKGIADAAIRYCFSWFAKNGIEKIVSEVIGDNSRARAFYRKVGFRELCRLKRNYKRNNRYVDTLVIEKFL